MTDKKFDCIAFKRTAQLAIYEEIKGMTREEEMAYFRTRAESGSMGSWWRNIPVGRQHPTPVGAGCAENTERYEPDAD
jgi:hypothetical protein